MPHEFQINCKVGLLKETFTGLLGLDMLTESNATIISHPDFREGLNFLTDMCNAQLPFGYKEMYKHVRSLPPLHISKQAFIVTDKIGYGMIRMFLSLTEYGEVYKEAQIFASIEEGMKWLTS